MFVDHEMTDDKRWVDILKISRYISDIDVIGIVSYRCLIYRFFNILISNW